MTDGVVCFHGKEWCAFCGIGHPPPKAEDERKVVKPVPEAARIAVPRCAVCGTRSARRNAIGLYEKPCAICESNGHRAPKMGAL